MTIQALAEETIFKMFSFLEPADLFRSSHVCRLWKRIGNDHRLWTRWPSREFLVFSEKALFERIVKFAKLTQVGRLRSCQIYDQYSGQNPLGMTVMFTCKGRKLSLEPNPIPHQPPLYFFDASLLPEAEEIPPELEPGVNDIFLVDQEEVEIQLSMTSSGEIESKKLVRVKSIIQQKLVPQLEALWDELAEISARSQLPKPEDVADNSVVNFEPSASETNLSTTVADVIVDINSQPETHLHEIANRQQRRNKIILIAEVVGVLSIGLVMSVLIINMLEPYFFPNQKRL